MKIAHLSDIHFGRIAHPHILDALVEDVEHAGVDVIAVSGDLTQRALPKQFRDAVVFLRRFTSPQIVVPGNHDVFPWWKPWARLKKPVARFQDYFGEELIRSFELPGLALLGINSAHGHTIKGGKITPAIDRTIAEYFEKQSPGVFKTLMLHHHLRTLDALKPHDICIGGPETFDTASKHGVNLILCGHAHVSHVESPDRDNAQIPVIASAGTATSDRGRRSNKHRNFYNLIEIQKDRFSIQERAFQPEEHRFVSARNFEFLRGETA